MDDAGPNTVDRGEDAASWPTCPRCRSRRHTSCPYCGTAGSDFRIVEPAWTPDEDRKPPSLWILCPLCDELFAARFSRRCEWCGFDFGEGIDWDAAHLLAHREEQLTARAVLAAALLTGVVALVTLYFVLLTSNQP